MIMMRKISIKYLVKMLLLGVYIFAFISNIQAQNKKSERSGNPVFAGWYADPEGIILNNQYWVYPTYSAPYKEQVFMDAFSSPDLIHWRKHKNIIDTASIQLGKNGHVGTRNSKKG